MAFFSLSSADYANQIKSLVKPTYTSKYNNLIEQNLNDILNKKAFSYDFNASPLYHMYADKYSKDAKEAGMNAAANAAFNTSGFANSYATTAAAQANQQVLNQLNEKVPELYNAALSNYQNQLNNQYQKLNTLVSEESRLYGQYRDSVSDYYSDWGNLQNGYETALSKENFDEEMAFKRARAEAEDAQAAAQLAYQRERDAVADSQWQKSYEQALAQAKGVSSAAASYTPAATTKAATTNASSSSGITKIVKNTGGGSKATYTNPSTVKKTIKQYTK